MRRVPFEDQSDDPPPDHPSAFESALLTKLWVNSIILLNRTSTIPWMWSLRPREVNKWQRTWTTYQTRGSPKRWCRLLPPSRNISGTSKQRMIKYPLMSAYSKRNAASLIPGFSTSVQNMKGDKWRTSFPPFPTTFSARATRLWKSRASCLQSFVSDNACLTTGHYSALTTASEDACQSDLHMSLNHCTRLSRAMSPYSRM